MAESLALAVGIRQKQSGPLGEDEVDIAQILLGVHNSPAIKAQPAPKRPRFDSEFSLVVTMANTADTLSDLCARENALLVTESSSAGTGDDDVEDDESSEEELEESPEIAQTADYAPFVHARDATLSAAAAAFLQKRRSEWAERPLEVGPSVASNLTGVEAVLPADQLAMYNQNGRIGIYDSTERKYIIERYMAKRARRHWNKKIRYNCRKNLADRRIRVKGRFVKAEIAASIASKEVNVAGAYVPAVRHEQKVERLLSLRAEAQFGSGRANSPAQSERGGSKSPVQRRPRSSSVGAAEDIYSYTYRSYSYSSRRMQAAAVANAMRESPRTPGSDGAVEMSGRKRPRSSSFHS